MDDILKYYNLNRAFLSCVGLWPYQNTIFTKIHIVCMFILFSYNLIIQLMTFMTKFSIYLLLEVLSVLFISIVFWIKYNTIYLNLDKIKLFLELIEYDWKQLKDAKELEIMRKQASTGQLYTKIFAVVMYVIAFFFVMTHYVPIVLDVIMPLTEPRPRKLLVRMEIVDQQKYFHFLMLNIIISAFFGMTTIIATETFFMILIQHVCGLLQIASYRIKRAFNHNSSQILNRGRKCIVCIRLASAINIHNKAIIFCEYVKFCFVLPYLVLVACGVVSLSINLFRLTEALAVSNKMDIIIIFAFICGHFCYMFCCNYIGQELINYSVDVFYQTWSTKWYTSFVHSQKMLTMILRRSANPCLLVIDGLFIISLEGFASLLSLSSSYFAVIYSTRYNSN